LGQGRGAVAGVVRALLFASILCFSIGLAACSTHDGGSNPEEAVQSLIAAARAGDRVAVYQRLGPRTRARIDELMSSARRTGATRVLRPEDLVTVGWVPPAWEAAGTRQLHREGDEAEVEVYSGGGDRQSVRVVREAKSWKVELPLR
jgi:hypothetical protein